MELAFAEHERKAGSLVTVVLVVGALVVGYLGPHVYRMARTWWRDRQRDEWCAFCGAAIRGRGVHTIITVPNDDLESSFGGGGTYIRATACPAHCPGGCDKRHLRQRASLLT